MRINILFIIIFTLSKVNVKKIKINFERKRNENSKIYFMEEYLWNNIITKLKVGSNKKEINFSIRLQEYPLILIGENTVTEYEKYNSSLSKSYKKLNEKHILSSFTFYSNSTLSEENFFIENNNLNLQFLLTNEINIDSGIKEIGIIGLGIQDPTLNHNLIKETNLIFQLKKNNLISDLIFTIKFINDFQGEIILGENNYNIYDNKNNLEGFNFIKTENLNGIFFWGINFDEIYINNNIIDYDVVVKFKIELNIIKPNSQVLEYLKKMFFDDLTKDKNCFINELNEENDYYYSCNKNIDIKKFPQIKFYLKPFQQEFILNYNDLIIENNNLYYFLIIFRNYPQGFEVGFPFMKKYYFLFDYDTKSIGIFKEGNQRFNYFNFLIIIFVIIIIILILYYIYYFRKENRRKRINEVEDNYDYIPHNLMG